MTAVPLVAPRRPPGRWGGGLGLVVLALWAAHGAGLGQLGQLDLHGAQALRGVLRPDVDPAVLRDVARAAAQTLQMAVAGLLLSAAVGAPLAVLLSGSTRAPRAVRTIARLVTAVLRGVPELVYALVFVAVIGLGPAAGTLAVAVHGAGLLGKLWRSSSRRSRSGPCRRCG